MKTTGKATSKKCKNSNPTKANAETSKSEGFYLDNALDKEIAGYCQRSETRQKGSFQSALQDGKELDRLIKIIEGDKYKDLARRPNFSDPFLVIASHRNCKVGSKQLRRQWQFYQTVNAMKEANIEPPMIGLTFYSEVSSRLKSPKAIAEVLQKCLDEDLSIRDLLALLGGSKSPNQPRNWRDSLDSDLNKIFTELGEIEQQWKKSKEPLGESRVRFEELNAYIQTTFLSGKVGPE